MAFEAEIVEVQDLENYKSELQDNSKVLEDLDVIENCGGNLKMAARILANRELMTEGIIQTQEERTSLWEQIKEEASNIICHNNDLTDAIINSLSGLITFLLSASPSLLLATVVTPLSIYILQVGKEKFCTHL